MKKFFVYSACLLLCFGLLASGCRARDCKGRKKTVKTNMGGWL
jgi:hypothetical protein